MNKEQIKDEIILTVKKAIADNAEIYDEDYISADSNDTDHMAEQVAENLYNAGYRKTFTSDLASDTQKAFKEGYIKGFDDRDEEFKIIIGRNEQLLKRNAQFEEKLSEYKKPIDKFIKDREKQAVRDFAEMLKKKFDGYEAWYYNGYEEGYHDLQEEIDELLKEYEK